MGLQNIVDSYDSMAVAMLLCVHASVDATTYQLHALPTDCRQYLCVAGVIRLNSYLRIYPPTYLPTCLPTYIHTYPLPAWRDDPSGS